MTARVSLPAPVAAAPGIPTDAAGATEAPPAAKVEALPLSLAIAAVVLVVVLFVIATLAYRHPGAFRYTWTQLLGQPSECTVCLCDFNEGELLRYLLPCEHRFHVSCIDHWLANRTTCPVCRIDLKATSLDVSIETRWRESRAV
ncbi:unnamed protein product [Closterium sp. NIES-65]|nr:unnamed protein product [Closterium sp. NIES-65]